MPRRRSSSSRRSRSRGRSRSASAARAASQRRPGLKASLLRRLHAGEGPSSAAGPGVVKTKSISIRGSVGRKGEGGLFVACVTTGGGKRAVTKCADARNPRLALGHALRTLGAAVTERSGAFASLGGFGGGGRKRRRRRRSR